MNREVVFSIVPRSTNIRLWVQHVIKTAHDGLLF